jgi:hypothetical protein
MDDIDIDYIPDDYDYDLESVTFTESLTSESNTESTKSDDNSADIEIPFLFSNANFEKAREFIEEDENDILSLKDIIDTDIDIETDASTSIFDSESTISGLTEGNEYDITDSTNTSKSLSMCPILDFIDGTIKCCSIHDPNTQRPLSQLIGSWEINPEIVQEAQKDNNLSSIGVCYSHFLYDQNQLHSSNIKKQRKIEKSWVFCRRCLLCNKYKYFFSRGKTCLQHIRQVFGKNVQVPCVGLKVCPVFEQEENNKNPEYRPRYICSECFITHGGHFNERKGRGNTNFECIDMHKNDTNEALQIIGRWILSMAEIPDENKKVNLLACLTNMLSTFFDNTKSISTIINRPSLLFIKIALKLEHINVTKLINQKYEITPETATDLGKSLGIMTWKSRHDVQKNKNKLENPISLNEYQSGFPIYLTNFFNGFIETLQRKKHEVLKKK